MLVLVDHRDSFVYNLVHGFGELGAETVVRRSDTVDVDELAALAPRGIVLSSGSGRPEEAGRSLDIVRWFAGRVPILGVGFGLLCIAAAFGARIVASDPPVHGRACPVVHFGSPLYRDMPSPFHATCYHSLTVDQDSIGPDLEVTATTERGEVAGLRHRDYDVEGVHFHPESILTERGYVMLANFLQRTGVRTKIGL